MREGAIITDNSVFGQVFMSVCRWQICLKEAFKLPPSKFLLKITNLLTTVSFHNLFKFQQSLKKKKEYLLNIGKKIG